jgi:oxaloacetate decarboxylase gamma subunit
MEDVNFVLESLKIMLLGMGVVFTFLALLVVLVNLQATLIAKFFPEKEPPKVSDSGVKRHDDGHHVAAIIAAVSEFRKKS